MGVKTADNCGQRPQDWAEEVDSTHLAEGSALAAVKPLNWHELWANDAPAVEWLAEPLVARGRLTAIYSPPKAGKSLLMLEIAAAIATGRTVLGRRTTPARVMYLDMENDPRGDTLVRLQDMGYQPEDLDNLVMFSFPQLRPFNTPSGGRELLALAQAWRVDVVIIDTVSRLVEGEENANDTWNGFYMYAGLLLKRAGIACVRLDHTGKDVTRGQRGGSAKAGDVDAVWRLSASGNTIRIVCEMARQVLAEPDQELTLTRHTQPLRHDRTISQAMEARDLRIANLSADLDRLGVLPNVGRTTAGKVLRGAGVRYSTEELSQAIQTRKNLSGGLSGQPPAAHLSDDPTDSLGQEGLI